MIILILKELAISKVRKPIIENISGFTNNPKSPDSMLSTINMTNINKNIDSKDTKLRYKTFESNKKDIKNNENSCLSENSNNKSIHSRTTKNINKKCNTKVNENDFFRNREKSNQSFEILLPSFTNLNNSQHFEGSTLSLSNNRTKPKTSKEILQEISRLTNGTTPNLKQSDLDTSFSSNPSRTIKNHNFFSSPIQKYIRK